jgi:hypothetical protein
VRGLSHDGVGRTKCNSGISNWTWNSRGGNNSGLLKAGTFLKVRLIFYHTVNTVYIERRMVLRSVFGFSPVICRQVINLLAPELFFFI